MTNPSLRATLALATVAALVGADRAGAQCATCPQPTVAYSPVVAAQPAVLQQTNVYDGWYPGKWLGRLFSRPAAPVYSAPAYAAPVATQPTFVTAAYRPTFPPSYTTYSASYAPAYTASYAPAYTVARPVALAAPSCSTCYSNPCSCATTAYHPVTLSALSPCCNTCSTGCDSCSGGVVSAGYDAPVSYGAPSGGCSNCAGGQTYTSPPAQPNYGNQNYGGQNYGGSPEPTPAIPPASNVPETRVNRPEIDDPNYDGGEASPNDLEEGDTSWWDPPQLFDNRDRSAARRPAQSPTTNVWNAVYHQPAAAGARSVQQTAYRPATPPAPRNKQVGASGWRSAD